MIAALLLSSMLSASPAAEPEVRAQIDWQGHPAMHIPWFMFTEGLTDRTLAHRTWRHMWRQTVSEPAMAGSGVRVFLAAAIAAERARNPEQARRLIGWSGSGCPPPPHERRLLRVGPPGGSAGPPLSIH